MVVYEGNRNVYTLSLPRAVFSGYNFISASKAIAGRQAGNQAGRQAGRQAGYKWMESAEPPESDKYL